MRLQGTNCIKGTFLGTQTAKQHGRRRVAWRCTGEQTGIGSEGSDCDLVRWSTEPLERPLHVPTLEDECLCSPIG